LGEVPPFLLNESHQFLLIVIGCYPIHINQDDSRGWGEARYFVRMGYKNILHDKDLLEKSTIWKEIWNPDGLPKINTFGWKLAHNKLLTGKHLLL
jgi:hypothetical protein